MRKKKGPLELCRVFRSVGSTYEEFPNEAGKTYVNVPRGRVLIAAFRGQTNDTHNGFMLESMIDDAAPTPRE